MKYINNSALNFRKLLKHKNFISAPCCFDALSAKMIENAGFDLTVLSGFSTSATRLCMPDLGLISFSEVYDQARNIKESISIPLIVDADNGYGNIMNVRRTAEEFIKLGCAGIIIEDQVLPKRCGHTPGKEVVNREESYDRIKAVADIRDDVGDIVIIGRTDANHTHDLDEAIIRGQEYHKLGADIVFIEAPKNIEEMKIICKEIPAKKIINLLEGGITPILPLQSIEELGFNIAFHPLTLLAASMSSMKNVLELLKQNKPTDNHMLNFNEIKETIGFNKYYKTISKYNSMNKNNKINE